MRGIRVAVGVVVITAIFGAAPASACLLQGFSVSAPGGVNVGPGDPVNFGLGVVGDDSSGYVIAVNGISVATGTVGPGGLHGTFAMPDLGPNAASVNVTATLDDPESQQMSSKSLSWQPVAQAPAPAPETPVPAQQPAESTTSAPTAETAAPSLPAGVAPPAKPTEPAATPPDRTSHRGGGNPPSASAKRRAVPRRHTDSTISTVAPAASAAHESAVVTPVAPARHADVPTRRSARSAPSRRPPVRLTPHGRHVIATAPVPSASPARAAATPPGTPAIQLFLPPLLLLGIAAETAWMRARAVEVGEPPSDPTTADDAYAVHLAALEAELQEMISEERAARLYADAAAPPLARSR